MLDLLHREQHPTAIAATLRVSVATVFNIKRRYLIDGLDATLTDKPRSDKPPVIDGTARAKITALACSAAPHGHARWTLRLLADKAVELGFVDTISHTTVNEVLKTRSETAPENVMVHWRDDGRVPGPDGRCVASLHLPVGCHASRGVL